MVDAQRGVCNQKKMETSENQWCFRCRTTSGEKKQRSAGIWMVPSQHVVKKRLLFFWQVFQKSGDEDESKSSFFLFFYFVFGPKQVLKPEERSARSACESKKGLIFSWETIRLEETQRTTSFTTPPCTRLTLSDFQILRSKMVQTEQQNWSLTMTSR